MENNKEIRQRMNIYRGVLLVINWIVSIIGIIVGFALTGNSWIRYVGIGVVIGSIILGIIGHFLINVALAIPFILLNNGDILESLEENIGNTIASNLSNTSGREILESKFKKKCTRCKKEISEGYTACPHCGNNTFE